MKKLFSLFLALIMIFTLAACGAKDSENTHSVKFSPGVVDGNTYTSDFAGISFTAPQGYEYFTEEMIAEAYNITTEYLELGEIDSMVYDMYCYNEDTQSSINVNFENLNMTHGGDITVEEYIESCMTSYSITFNSFGDVALQSIEESTIDISGTNYSCINMVIDNEGSEFFETLIVKKMENYMMTCTIAAYTEAEMENIVSGISEI